MQKEISWAPSWCVLLSPSDVCIAFASGFLYAKAELSVPSFPPQHMRKPWAQCKHAAASMQKALLHVEFQLRPEHFLSVSTPLFVLGKWQDSQAVWRRDQKPRLVTAGGVMCWWCWRQEREGLSLPQYNSHSHPLKQEFPKLFIQYNKRCKEFFCCFKVFTYAKQSLPGWASLEV